MLETHAASLDLGKLQQGRLIEGCFQIKTTSKLRSIVLDAELHDRIAISPQASGRGWLQFKYNVSTEMLGSFRATGQIETVAGSARFRISFSIHPSVAGSLQVLFCDGPFRNRANHRMLTNL